MASIDDFSIGETPVFLDGPDGLLEAILYGPKEKAKSIVAIICHPHPLFEGTMHNKVVTTLHRTFKGLDLHTVRFNYRGVGKSEGTYGETIGETEDLKAIIKWVQKQKPSCQIWLAGFSFGAYITAKVASCHPIDQLITIAPAVDRFYFNELAPITCPWIIIQGECDELVPVEKVKAWHQTLQPSPKLIIMPEASHFFHGKLVELRTCLVDLLSV